MPETGGTRLTIRHSVEGELGVPRAKELVDDHWRLAIGNLMGELAGGRGILLPDYGAPRPEIRQVIEISAPPATVFRALITPALLNEWLGSESAVVEPRAGGRFSLGWHYSVDGRDVAGGPTRILDIEENVRLVLDWPDYRGDSTVPDQTISFHLEPTDAGTRVTFVHAGFIRTTDLSDYPFGWSEFLENLAALVARVHAAA